MSGRHSFRELTEGFSPERHQRIEAIKEELLAEMLEGKITVTNCSQLGGSEDAR